MPNFLTRTDRVVQEVPGVGGMLRIGQPNDLITPAYSSVILDITNWRIRHTMKLVDVTHSGSFGAQKMATIGRHWEAQIALAFNSRVRSTSDPWSGFLETQLVGNQAAGYNVSVIFFLGDPLHYIDDNHIQRASYKYYAPLGLLGNIETVNDATGKDVVRLTAAMQGNSKMQGWTGLQELLTDQVF